MANVLNIDLIPIKEKEYIPNLDYKNNHTNFTGARFLKECCMKLKASVITTAQAATYYHTFFSSVNFQDYDPYLISCTCIYLASKVRNDDLKIRDIINVGHHTIHINNAPLSLEPYFELRDSLVEAELLLMRMLNFEFDIDMPHRYLFYFIMSIRDWVGEDVFEKFPITQTCWSILNDSYHYPICLQYCPQLIAASIIYMTLQIYGVVVPGTIGEPGNLKWFSVLHPSCKLVNIWAVCSEIIKCYNEESNLAILKEDKSIMSQILNI